MPGPQGKDHFIIDSPWQHWYKLHQLQSEARKQRMRRRETAKITDSRWAEHTFKWVFGVPTAAAESFLWESWLPLYGITELIKQNSAWSWTAVQQKLQLVRSFWAGLWSSWMEKKPLLQTLSCSNTTPKSQTMATSEPKQIPRHIGWTV